MKSIFCHKAKAAPLAANTLRFEFGDQSYNPVTAGVGSSGTWKRCEFMPGNVWDWTNTNTSWASAFSGGSYTNPSTFADYENNPVKIIAAGDTSSVTDFSRLFQYCYAITEVCPIDTSGATNVFLMFSYCHNCEKFPDMDFSSTTDCRGVYQNCYKMNKAPSITFPTDHTFSLANFFLGCVGLETIPMYDISMCTDMSNMFDMHEGSSVLIKAPHSSLLKSIPLLDTSNVSKMTWTFRKCVKLQEIPEFNCSNITFMNHMFEGADGYEMHLKSVPNLDYSKVTRFDGFMKYNVDITEIPEMNIEANVSRCDNMFNNCPNVKSGQKALYDTLSEINTITNHADCFTNCGSDTEEGRAELAQIPTSWGGTKEEV